MKMRIIHKVQEMQKEAESLRLAGKTIGLVPTMGSLHEGHLSLVKLAKKKADIVVMSVYVNPIQFGPKEDLDRYPRDIDRDASLAKAEGVDILFNPSNHEIYPEGYLTYVEVEKMTGVLCGKSRPSHFRGVTTVCAKLFQIVKPHFAVFGQKDAQQSAVIRQMVRDLNFDMEIIVAPIVREPDGLAMSSRNRYLSDDERKDALSLHESLILAEEKIREGERDTGTVIGIMQKHIKARKSTRIDYISIVDPVTLEPVPSIKGSVLAAVAVFVGGTRLIDNCVIAI